MTHYRRTYRRTYLGVFKQLLKNNYLPVFFIFYFNFCQGNEYTIFLLVSKRMICFKNDQWIYNMLPYAPICRATLIDYIYNQLQFTVISKTLKHTASLINKWVQRAFILFRFDPDVRLLPVHEDRRSIRLICIALSLKSPRCKWFS